MFDRVNGIYILYLSKENSVEWENDHEYMSMFITFRLNQIAMLMKAKSQVVTLNYIRDAFGMSQFRAEAEMCFGPNPEKPMKYDVIWDEFGKNGGITIRLHNIIDLRQYREL